MICVTCNGSGRATEDGYLVLEHDDESTFLTETFVRNYPYRTWYCNIITVQDHEHECIDCDGEGEVEVCSKCGCNESTNGHCAEGC